MRMIAAAFAGAAIFLAGCNGNGASEETAGDTEEDNAELDEGESDEEADQE